MVPYIPRCARPMAVRLTEIRTPEERVPPIPIGGITIYSAKGCQMRIPFASTHSKRRRVPLAVFRRFFYL
jgi:hypothetical protein